VGEGEGEKIDRERLPRIDQNRRTSKDYERLPESSEALIYLAMVRLMVRRLAHS
jgi:hypothetical protein